MLLGIDFGSSGCKGVLFSPEGTILAKASQEYSVETIGADGCEMDPQVFFDAFCTVVKEIAEQGEIRAIGISSHGETVIPIGRDRQAAGPALMNSDNRGLCCAQRLENTLTRKRIYEICGLPAHPMYSLPKICWFRKNRPEQFSKTDRFCTVPGYLLSRLGLEPLTDDTLASRFMAFDIQKRTWSQEILSAAEIKQSYFCPTVPAGTSAGVIPAEIAKGLGLSEGVSVVMAGHDQPCGAFGAGLVRQGSALSAGSYECLCSVGDKPAAGEKALSYSFNTYCHVCDGSYLTLAFFPGALCVNWFLKLLYPEAERGGLDEVFSNIFNSMKENGPSGLLVTPHLIGACNPGWNPLARGGIYGLHPGIAAPDMMKGVFEGIACELRLNLDALRDVGTEIPRILIHGGNARQNASVQLRADITGCEFQRLEDRETGCRGAAMLAGLGIGLFADYQNAAENMQTKREKFLPQTESMEKYEKQFQRYRDFYYRTENL